ncbi:hypothetical protein [Streptomyces sp. NPDC048638]|uniref:hypothetical protein n=1 Tax=Streptomyces sp. NPDC048638 TaxID=3365580 RepID=UPI0037158C89
MRASTGGVNPRKVRCGTSEVPAERIAALMFSVTTRIGTSIFSAGWSRSCPL